MLAQETASAVMRRCRRAFPQSDRPAEAQTQIAPITMNAMERMRRHRKLAKRPAVRSGAVSVNIDPGGTVRPSSVYDQARRVRAQRLQFAAAISERLSRGGGDGV